jgi:hypothetical protein
MAIKRLVTIVDAAGSDNWGVKSLNDTLGRGEQQGGGEVWHLNSLIGQQRAKFTDDSCEIEIGQTFRQGVLYWLAQRERSATLVAKTQAMDLHFSWRRPADMSVAETIRKLWSDLRENPVNLPCPALPAVVRISAPNLMSVYSSLMVVAGSG